MQPHEMNFACPQCGQTGPESWETSSEVFALMKVTKGSVHPVRFLTDQGTPVKTYFCTTCGYTVLFRANIEDITN